MLYCYVYIIRSDLYMFCFSYKTLSSLLRNTSNRTLLADWIGADGCENLFPDSFQRTWKAEGNRKTMWGNIILY